MSFKLEQEVRDFVRGSELDPEERLLLLIIAYYAQHDDRTIDGVFVPARTCWPSNELLIAEFGPRENTLKQTFRKLSARGIEVRVPLTKDKNGNPQYTVRGKQRTFRLPILNTAKNGVEIPTPLESVDSVGDSEGGQIRPPFESAEPVDNSNNGGHIPTPLDRMVWAGASNGVGSRTEWCGNSHTLTSNEHIKNLPPYVLTQRAQAEPVDNFQGEEDQNLISVADLESPAHTDFTANPAEPRPAATDEASAARTKQVSGSGSVLSPWNEEKPTERPASTRSQSARRARESTSPASRQDRDALAVLTADGTDHALAQDMLDRAKRDPDTKVPTARIKQPKYREELRSAVIRDRNHAHALAAKTAGPCPHGELGGLVPTRAGKPTCATCRAEHNRQKESA